MLKKIGLVTVGVTAGLLTAAPFASAAPKDDCNVDANPENIGEVRCSTIGQGNGQGNLLNGVELPGLPDAPELPELPIEDILGALPDLSNLPVQI